MAPHGPQDAGAPTRILILDDDPNLARVARDVLKPQGLDVRASDQAGAAMALVRLSLPALVLVNLDMPDDEGLRFIELLRAYPQGGGRVQVIGNTTREVEQHRELRRALRRLRVSRVIPRPPSLLELPQVVGEVLSETPPPDEPGARRKANPDALRELARVWLEQDTGVAATGSGLAGRFLEGGLADADSIGFVDQVLREGLDMSFRRCRVNGERRADLLAQRLWHAARALAPAEAPPGWLRRAPLPSIWMARLEELPVGAHALRVVHRADGATPMQRLLDTLHLREADVSADLQALEALGLLELGAPQSLSSLSGELRARTSLSGEPPLAGAGESARTSFSGASSRTSSSGEPRPRPTLSGEPARTSSSGEPRPRPTLSGEPARTSSSGEPSRSGARAERDPSPSPGGGPRPPPAAARPSAPMDPTQALLLLKRLRREVERLESADPFTVLGLPYSAEPERVRGAALRMRARYQEVLERRGVSDEIHRLARVLLEQLHEAEHAALGAPAPAVAQPLAQPTTENESRAFAAGQEAMRRGDWPQAVRAFRAAHHSRVDSAEYMAHLGWALAQDRARGSGRLDEALELLELAESFEPDNPQLQRWLCEVELESQHLDRARARAQRLLRRGDPSPATSALAARVEQALQAQDS